jgi:predicted anti-sigma-YlaC factor YlaD
MKPWVATHRETRDRLSDYIDGDLDAHTRTRIMRHLARCDRCRAMFESLTRTLEQLRSLGVDQVTPTPGTVEAVVEQIRRERH